MVAQEQRPVVLVRPDAEVMSRQRLPYFVGISGASAGATKLSLNMVVIPPAGAAEPHIHRGYETAIYVLQGRIDTRYGPGLRESLICEAGDFLFIAPTSPTSPSTSATPRRRGRSSLATTRTSRSRSSSTIRRTNRCLSQSRKDAQGQREKGEERREKGSASLSESEGSPS